MQTDRDLESWCPPWEMCSAPISKKPETGGLSWVFIVPPGYKLDRDIAAVLSSYKEFGSQIACPIFTTTTACKKLAHQKLPDPEWSVHCAGGAKPWHGPFVVMQGEFWAISYWQIKSFCGVSKRCSEARLSGLAKEQQRWLERRLERIASLIYFPYWLHTMCPDKWQKSLRSSENSD